MVLAMDPVVIIPAFEPGEALIDEVAELRRRTCLRIVVVDDGSGPAFSRLFASAARIAGVTVLAHAANLGKGAALRTGMERVVRVHADAPGVVTADADGQHAVDDIDAVGRVLRAKPAALVLGVRRFSSPMPVGRQMANRAARAAFRLVTGVSLTDVQTGLRGIPRACLPHLLAMRSTRYEFEMEMLLWACASALEFVEQPIQTIYPGRGRASHFNAARDSSRIVGVLMRGAATSTRDARRDETSPGRWSAPGSERAPARSAVRR
jgi:glycosyltransferase involved in cell wall biosynthesis